MIGAFAAGARATTTRVVPELLRRRAMSFFFLFVLRANARSTFFDEYSISHVGHESRCCDGTEAPREL